LVATQFPFLWLTLVRHLQLQPASAFRRSSLKQIPLLRLVSVQFLELRSVPLRSVSERRRARPQFQPWLPEERKPARQRLLVQPLA
jgi:hypothetical protein